MILIFVFLYSKNLVCDSFLSVDFLEAVNNFIAQACRQLISSDTRVAVITNDQGLNQVDSAYLKGLRLPVGEVAEGCFAAGLTNWRKL